jgi:hypothetical protein
MATKPKRDDPDQGARFIEAAKRLGAEDREKQFERVFKKIASPQARAKSRKKSRS